ncbi:MAG: DUF1016 N-terminal domain-containing protein, partial [Planctomycetaceae bacterium]|nr:DUF1016 N-terminal domain-containing protein [Planctomycetaceae bacterium]
MLEFGNTVIDSFATRIVVTLSSADSNQREDAVAKKKPVKALDYAGLLGQVKVRIQHSQVRAVLSVNAELIQLYWDIGRLLDERQQQEGWGAAVIPRLARDLRNDIPEIQGFSERNIGRMIALYRAYPQPSDFLPQPVAKLAVKKKLPQGVSKMEPAMQSVLWSIPWGHHAVLMDKVSGLADRLWYMRQTLQEGWSRNVLTLMIKSNAHARQGKALGNFAERLPPAQSDLVVQTLKDPYLFDFLTLTVEFRERELETKLLENLERFLL